MYLLFWDFLPENWEILHIFSIGKGAHNGPKISLGKSLNHSVMHNLFLTVPLPFLHHIVPENAAPDILLCCFVSYCLSFISIVIPELLLIIH